MVHACSEHLRYMHAAIYATQKQSDLGPQCLSRHFSQLTSVQNFQIFSVHVKREIHQVFMN